MYKGRAITIQGFDRKRPLDKLCDKAENNGIYSMESERGGVAYMYEDDEIAIVTSRGCVRMSVETAGLLVEELSGLLEDIKDMRRMRCRL